MIQKKENPFKVLIRRTAIFRKFLLSGIRVLFNAPYWHNKTIMRMLLVSAAVNIGTWAYLIANQTEGSFPIILHYNLFFGVDSVGDYRKIFLLPLIGTAVFILNSLLSHFFYKIDRLASYLLTLNVLIIQIFLFLSGYLIIRVNS